ncbi:uncharacterized protein N7479_000702 [Penicillium vulpinum]|uniref:Uncharacterized protein n=1 Tax=Penicillium vulpinum TaxID=29845 RepID=A0A1V6S6V6_9EURO|nr:uncharacterized protein N7479_000702 [Penicillium vulpinum]KAJ5970784.1 hypothetical protein N7479_000702 [Penicillium vulpinum]OQE09454.1 hypothetical protein PENVUL_c006G02795 [Penicillium vulpinum]
MRYGIAMGAVAVTMRATGASADNILEVIGISERAVDKIYKRALRRGFDPDSYPLDISEAMVVDAHRSGRHGREAKLAWHLKHRGWTLKDWKNVTWTNETSAILIHRR